MLVLLLLDVNVVADYFDFKTTVMNRNEGQRFMAGGPKGNIYHPYLLKGGLCVPLCYSC